MVLLLSTRIKLGAVFSANTHVGLGGARLARRFHPLLAHSAPVSQRNATLQQTRTEPIHSASMCGSRAPTLKDARLRLRPEYLKRKRLLVHDPQEGSLLERIAPGAGAVLTGLLFSSRSHTMR